jgi:EEF1A lysine methyltransferase 1
MSALSSESQIDPTPSTNDVKDENDEEEEEDNDELLSCENELSAFAMAALNQYLTESKGIVNELELPAENFKLSQFWFDEPSREMLAREALNAPLPDRQGAAADEPRRIALVSAPSIWYTIEALKKSEGFPASVMVLDIDPRFESSIGDEFVLFDYNHAADIPAALHGTFDYMICAPPYVSIECIDKYIAAFKLLARHPNSPTAFVIGSIMEDAFAERGFGMKDMEIHYSSKFCTPMRYYCNY